MKRILFLLVVITGLYIIFNHSWQFNALSASKQDGNAAVSADTKVIKVDVSSVSTIIIPEDRDDLKAVYTGKQKLNIRENGDDVEVSLKSKWFDWFNWGPFSEKKKLKIYIPEDYNQNMQIDLGSGNVNFSGSAKSKPMKLNELTVDIGSGNMNLKNLSVNKFKQDVSSGNVDIDYLKTKTGSFNISSGNLDITHYTGAVEADVASGELNIQIDKLVDSIKLDLSSGEVGLDLPNNADFTLNGDVSSGNISCDLPLTSKDLNNKSIKGTHGSGKYKIDLDVSSGSIHIR
ncbi:LiaG family protein [Neobacillus bataviensis]|uniref:LiaG family protein n=1 Tax=Neobacillus bataviensis TaxID=220685 RepID=UPI001CBFE975|nr:DUF4097 family beta strand repeat-containing protein [Neobacillus bataviensis]